MRYPHRVRERHQPEIHAGTRTRKCSALLGLCGSVLLQGRVIPHQPDTEIGIIGCHRIVPRTAGRGIRFSSVSCTLAETRLSRVDERELRFSQDEPLVGWRLFRVRFGDHGFVLTAPLIHDPDFEWFPSRSITARCYEREHPAPAVSCRCGLYVAVDGTRDSLAGYLAESAHDQATPIYAEVACSGRAFVDRRGVRVAQLTITRLATSESFWADEATMIRAVADLTARYGIVIDGMDAVPGWVRDNDRPTGAPTGDVDIDLDGLAERLTMAAESKRESG